MKKGLALMIALLMLLLCACGQETAPAQNEQVAVGEQPVEIPETNADEYFVQEKTLDDGTIVKIHRLGGPEGQIVQGFCTYPNGLYTEEGYNSDGNLEYMIMHEPDGAVHEMYYYPSRNLEKSISYNADGSYTETHYLDNATIDENLSIGHGGTISYYKYIAPDGTVEEVLYEIEEDGTRWDTMEWEDGTVVRTHYGDMGMRIEQLQDNESRDRHIQITYYENGNEKTRNSYYGEDKMTVYLEYYENSSVKYSLIERENSSKTEEKFNEAGYTTYFYDSNLGMEFFANDVGELVKYVSGGKVYEGDAIPSSARETFNQVRQVAAEDVSTTQEADGSSQTTTTYADGSVKTSGTTADGTMYYETISANGDRSYEEYYAAGTLKLAIFETADTYQEMHYDEDTFYTYFHQVVPGFELEITCDETGKVDKVLLNGQPQTDIESIVKDMFFRSW